MSSTRSLTITLLAASLIVYSAQGLLFPVMAPITRLVGLAEVDLGAVMTLSASMLLFTGSWWGREVDRIGVRAVLIRGPILAILGTAGFTLMVQLAANEQLPRMLVLSVFAITRGVLYGLGFAAVPVACLTYLASSTTGESARTKVMGAFGAAQGLSLVVGPAVGGLLAMGGLLLPVHVAPMLMAVPLIVIWFLPRPTQQVRIQSERLAWGDRRVLPFLLAGGALFLGLALIEVVMGFLVQDRLGLTDTVTAYVVATAGVLIGVGFAVTQALVAPRIPGGPRALIMSGSVLAVVGYFAALWAPSVMTLLPAMFIVAAGLGLAIPGYNAGATLAVEANEHAGVSGQLAATAGFTFIIGPLAGTTLYASHHLAPILGAAALSLLAGIVAATQIRSSAAVETK